jgi:hypothetical protein
MKVLGMITTGVVATVVAAGLVLSVLAIPDIGRYLRIRRM